MKLLEGITIVDFSQFLAGPSASLRLADFGAEVIKVEREGTGDLCRQLYGTYTEIDGETTVFHAINRNKKSVSVDLKTEKGKKAIRELVKTADVVMHNFRPGVMERLGFEYQHVKALNPEVIYASVSGYGTDGPWSRKPGQDLLLQSLSGLTWMSGNSGDGPVPMGLPIADMFAGAQLVQGILAALVRKGLTGKGGLVEVSMLESALDFQFEPLTVYFRDGGLEPERTVTNNAHAYLGAPYGVYETADGYLALAMGKVPQLGELLACPALLDFPEPASWFEERDVIKSLLADHLKTKPVKEWLAVLEPADIWCAEVLDWKSLMDHEGYRILEMEQRVERGNGTQYETTRCPIRIDGTLLTSSLGSPDIGEHNSQYLEADSVKE